jgi:phenylalanyl-tRNA synthetase beta chain
MKLTLSWLKEHLQTDAEISAIAEKLTMLGLEVASVTTCAAGLGDFVVGEVLEASKHPNADRLQICKVNTGTETLQVVCGAPNARAGMKGVFAAAGCRVPGTGLKLRKSKIRGEISNGMLLSMREMGLGDDHDGIVELPDDATPGAPAVEVMGLADPLIDIELTPNRGDCLGVRGIARDLAAAGLGTLKPLDCAPLAAAFKSPLNVALDFDGETADACPYFVGRLIRGVNNGESPKWLKERLEQVGLRPISALVDITNLMAMDLCRPLHVFDADKLQGGIAARLGRRGEKFTALDGKQYQVDETMTVIADDAGICALGGVIGGARTGCTEETLNVFVESAYFDPRRTAETGRKLNIISDSRYRFERGIDPAFLVGGMEIATRLILDICGGEASKLVVAGAEPGWRRQIPFRPERVKTLGGMDVAAADAVHILGDLGFTVDDKNGTISVTPPSWRGDIAGEADLVEEVMRVKGFDAIAAVSFRRQAALPEPALSAAGRMRSLVRRTLASRGLVEAVTLSFLAGGEAELFGGGGEDLRLVNPISSDLDAMRPSLLPNLIAAARRNADRGIGDAALFEVGPQYAGDGAEDQSFAAAGIRGGRTGPRHWARPPRPVDLYDVKADVLSVLDLAGIGGDRAQITGDAPGWYHPGRCGVLRLGPKRELARFGEIHPAVAAKMGLQGPLAGFEILLDNLPGPKKKKSAARPHLTLSAFQPVVRDFAFVLDDGVAAADVIAAARKADPELIEDVRVFDLFSGPGLEDGEKSLAISVVLQPMTGTLTDAEIDTVAKKIIAAVKAATAGRLRS